MGEIRGNFSQDDGKPIFVLQNDGNGIIEMVIRDTVLRSVCVLHVYGSYKILTEFWQRFLISTFTQLPRTFA